MGDAVSSQGSTAQFPTGSEPDDGTVVGTPKCPVCDGTVELTPMGYLTCREHGSEHYRVKADV